MTMSPTIAGRRRRREGRDRGEVVAGADCRRIPTNRVRETARRAVVAGLLLRAGPVVAQDLVNGGSVALTCDVCECEGTSDDGTITVFDLPSSGERIASVNAAYSEILTTSCGTPAIATDSTIYELSGVDDLASRETDIVSLASEDCATVEFTSSSTADCFIGPTSSLAFDTDVTVDVTFHFATWVEEAGGPTKYWYKLSTVVTGASSVDQEHQLCFQNGFVSVVFDLTVLGKTEQYNFELDFGSPTSADLPVDDTPAATDGLVCGAATTPAPVAPPTPAPAPAPAPETPAPVAPETPAPAATPAATEAPAVQGALTPAPSPAVSGNDTMTPAPTGGNVTATEAPAGAGVDDGNVTATAAPSPAPLIETPVPSTAGTQAQVTYSPADSAELEEYGCILPEGSPCTSRTPVSNTNDGIGDYFDPACDVPEGQERPTGCADDSSLCRRCYFNTPLYLENNNGSNPDYPDCPCCVLETYPADEAANLDGPRCENVSPAPTMVTTQPVAGDVQRSFESLGFDDTSWEINPGEAAALAALGLLAALTFFPICSKLATKSRKRRREQRWPQMRQEQQLSWRRRRPMALGLAAAFLGMQAEGQYTGGGEVEVSCTDCSFCEGSSDDGAVMVFDNPSTGGRVASVGGEYSEVAETSCGTSVFAAGDTIYELSGYDLESRTLEVWELSPDDCSIDSVPSTADCYSGVMDMSLDGGIEMTLTNCFCIYTEGTSTFYRSKVSANVVGATSISIPDDEIDVCLDAGFVSQLVTAITGGETYLYNFDLVVPGMDSSADLSVSSVPAAAQAFICGEDPTPAPVTPIPPTPEPATEAPVAPPTPEPTPAPVRPPTPAPVTPIPETPPPVTPAPVTPAPVTPAPVTPAPVTPKPQVAATEAPEPAPVPLTTAPILPETPQPTPAAVNTTAPQAPPTTAPSPLSTLAPALVATSVGITSSTVLAPGETLSPASAGGSGGGGGATLSPTGAGVTPAPTGSSRSAGTLAPGGMEDVEGRECELPEGDSCTSVTAVANINQGIGSFYDPACAAASSSEGGELPEGCQSNTSCRACLFNTPRWEAKNPGEDLPAFVDCPCCVLDVYPEDAASYEDGLQCEPAPTPTPSTASPVNDTDTGLPADLFFEDKPLRISEGGFDFGVAALALLGLLTFFPQRRRRTSRGDGIAASLLMALLLLVGGARGVTAQFTDGGDIKMSCGDCDCSGTSDAGTVTVFENPSSGAKVAHVEGELTEVVEASCGKEVIAVGTTIYELSGVDFGDRELEVVDLSSGDCTISTAPSGAECYSGTSSHSVGSATLDLTFCLCTTNDSGGSQWNVNVKAEVSGALSVSIPSSGLGICPDNGYISQLVTAEVDGEEYHFNFDLAQPGQDSSSDLSVGSGPSSDAQAFICGEEEEEVATTPAPSAAPEEEEVAEETPAPLSPEEPDPEPETPAPVDPETSLSTGPEATTSSTDDSSTSETSSSSTAPVEPETPGPTAATPDTPAPTVATRGLETPAPSAAAGGNLTAAPAAATATGPPAAAPTLPSATPGPTLAPTPGETLAPLTEAELEQVACKFPVEEPCTPTTPVANITKGLGAYYDPACTGVGCGVGSSGLCRTCYFDTPLFKEQLEESGSEAEIPDYAPCPCCVLEVYGEPFAQDRNGPRCVNATPAPTTTALDTEARGFESLGFEDNPMTLAGGEAVALGALGLFALFTFMPFCTKDKASKLLSAGSSMLARRSASASAGAGARLATRPPLSAGSCGARGRACASSACVARAIGAPQRRKMLVPGVHYLPRSAPVKHSRGTRLEYPHQPLSPLLAEAKGASIGRGERAKFPRVEWEGWGWTGVVGGEDDRGCEQETRQKADGSVALGTLAFPQRMMAKPRYGSPSSHRSGGGRGGKGDQGRHSPANGEPKNTSGSGSKVTATPAIIAINVAAYMMQANDPSFTTNYFNLGYLITQQGEWYRLATSMALHGGLAHLLCNCMSLGSMGPSVERILGTKKFVALYVCSGVAGNVLSCIVNPLTPSLGASGAIFGLLGAEATLLMRHSLASFLESIARTAFFAVMVALLVPNINHMAHLGGFLGGGVMTLFLRRR
eukprot:g4231.t1